MGHLKCWQFLSVKDFLDFLIKIFTSYFWTSVSVLFLNKQYLSIDYFWNPPYKSCLNPLSCCVDQKSWGRTYLKTVSITNFEQIPGCSGYDATKVKNLICYSTPLEKPTCHNIYKSSHNVCWTNVFTAQLEVYKRLLQVILRDKN